MSRVYRTWTERREARALRPRAPRVYPVADLARAMGIDPDAPTLKSRLARALDMDPSWVRRCLQDQAMLSATTADHWAARAGLHPDIVWPGWWDDPTDVEPLPGEDDPSFDTLEPASPERLQQLRQHHRTAA